MKLSKNLISLIKGYVLCPDQRQKNALLVSDLQTEIMKYGAALSQEAFDALSKSDSAFILSLYKAFPEFLKESLGANLQGKPLRPLVSTVVDQLDPIYFDEWDQVVKARVILQPIDEDGFNKIFTDIVSINQSIDPMNKLVVEWFAKNHTCVMPEVIPFKETLTMLAALRIPGLPVKTTTDVLRIAYYLSCGVSDIPTLPRKFLRTKYSSYGKKQVNPERAQFKFKKFKRADRIYLLSLLENTHCNPMEMAVKRGRWIRLGEILHPGDYHTKFPKAYAAFQAVRNDTARSWYSAVNKEFRKGPISGINKLAERPGEYARRLDWMVRKFPKHIDLIFEKFQAPSNKVLFEMYTHFENRLTETSRHIMIGRKRVSLPVLSPLKPEVVGNIKQGILLCLTRSFEKLEPLGAVYLDERLKDIQIPTNMKSLDLTSTPIVRGSLLPLPSNIVRAYVHWDGGRGHTDLDISASFHDKLGKKLFNCTFSSERLAGLCQHSGDVRHKPGKCSEYIDINLNYPNLGSVVVTVHNYDGGSIAKLNTYAGFEVITDVAYHKDLKWNPANVANAVKVMSESNGVYLFGIDAVEKKYTYIGIDSNSRMLNGSSAELQAYLPKITFSVYDLLQLHLEARGGRIVNETGEAPETYFKFEDFCTNYVETAKLMGI